MRNFFRFLNFGSSLMENKKQQRRRDMLRNARAAQAFANRHRRVTRRKIERDVCALISRGNVSLQQGEYITQEDMDTLQQELEAYFSSEQSKW